jgi:hypothetical protein
VAKSFTGDYLRPILEAAGTLAPQERAVTPSRNGKPASAPAAAALEPAPVSTNGRKRATANGAMGNEEATAAAAATMAQRIARESTIAPERPKTKAAQKRERQAANPRKETASEKDLRETRERAKKG